MCYNIYCYRRLVGNGASENFHPDTNTLKWGTRASLYIQLAPSTRGNPLTRDRTITRTGSMPRTGPPNTRIGAVASAFCPIGPYSPWNTPYRRYEFPSHMMDCAACYHQYHSRRIQVSDTFPVLIHHTAS